MGQLRKPWPTATRPRIAQNRHKRPIGAHFHSGGVEFSYLGQDLEEALGEAEETIARSTVSERTAEHLHDMLSGSQGVDEAVEACPNWCGGCFGLWSQMPGFGASQLELAFEIGEGDIDVTHGHTRIDVAE